MRSKLDFVSERLDRDEHESADELVKHSLDRLAFASQVSNVQSAFGAVGHDALDEMGSLANKATETVATFHASQYAAKWMPVDTHLTMKPTYVKVPVQSLERIKFFENERLAEIVANNAEDRETILAENAGLRGMLGLEERSSEQVEEIRDTEDGVNRALLMSAVEEIKRLKTRVTVLESEAARHRVASGGWFGGGGGEGGVDAQQMARLTTELARLEEDNGRQRWMIGEKDKQIKETQAKFAASEAYALRERLQESMEALQVAANLQAEQLQYLEDNALKKLDAMDDQIADVQDDLDVKCAHHGQLKDILRAFLEKGDDTLVPILVSLAGFSHAEATAIREERARRESRTVAGVAARFGRLGFKLGGATMEKLMSACAPPPGGIPKEGAVLPPAVAPGSAGVEKETEGETAAGEGATTAASTPAKSAPAARRREDEDEDEDGGYDGDGDASTAPPTAEKMPRSISEAGSAASSLAPTPTKVAGAVAAAAEELALPSPPAPTEDAGEETRGAETRGARADADADADAEADADAPSADTSAPTSPSPAPSPPAAAKPRAPRRRDGETDADRERRERERRERRERHAASGGGGGGGGHGHGHGHGHHGKKKEAFVGFEDEASLAREARERASARPALPTPKLLGKAAEREAARRREDDARAAASGGFAGFGGDDDDSDSD